MMDEEVCVMIIECSLMSSGHYLSVRAEDTNTRFFGGQSVGGRPKNSNPIGTSPKFPFATEAPAFSRANGVNPQSLYTKINKGTRSRIHYDCDWQVAGRSLGSV